VVVSAGVVDSVGEGVGVEVDVSVGVGEDVGVGEEVSVGVGAGVDVDVAVASPEPVLVPFLRAVTTIWYVDLGFGFFSSDFFRTTL
jgi:hypothetical protein